MYTLRLLVQAKNKNEILTYKKIKSYTKSEFYLT